MKILVQLTSIFFALFSFQNTYAQEGYEITVELDTYADSTAYLSYYYGKGQYYRDTSIVDKKGTIVFEGKDTLAHGLYSVIVSKSKIFDLMVDGQKMEFKTDTSDVIKNMQVKNSEENTQFFEYLKFLNEKQIEAGKIKNDPSFSDEQDRQKEMEELDNEVRAFIADFHKKYPGSFSSNFIYSIAFPEVPDPPRNDDGSMVDSNFSFKYYKAHYFENFDFSDGRLLRTNSFHTKMMYYMNKLTIQDADSLIKSADYILKQIKDKEMFRYALTTLTSKYERSENMGMDAVFVHLGKNYFMKGKADEWFSEKQLKELSDRVNALDPLLIGKKAPNIVVKDTAQKKFLQLYDIKSKYTIVYIWSPDCGHCKKATPKLKKLYDKYRNQGVEVFGIGNEFENKDWIEFINKHNLDWINGSDGGDFKSNFRNLYDVYSTPQTYLLDENKVILSKKMSIESLENILEYFIKKDSKKETIVNEK